MLELERQAVDDKNAAAKGWVKRIKTYYFVASLHLLSDAFPALAKLSKHFQSATVNFAQLQANLDATRTTIQVLKDHPGPIYTTTEAFIAELRSDDPEQDIVISVTNAQ